tara:strand:+ start:1300 stop:1641 length:342 start_codon:yes stop_codon:yes gene_type:complete
MPHAELKFSSDLNMDVDALLRKVERIILSHDKGSGECKGRAYPTDIFHHSHCLLEISMLPKTHRNPAFTKALLRDLETELRRHLDQRCFLSLGIRYSDENYVTTEHVPQESQV